MGIISSQIPDIQCDHMPGVVSSWNISPCDGTESLCTGLSHAKLTPFYFLWVCQSLNIAHEVIQADTLSM